MENQHKKIQGYRDFDQATVNMINEIKKTEAFVAESWFAVGSHPDADRRELALARTAFEEAFMHLVKSIARPDTPWQQ